MALSWRGLTPVRKCGGLCGDGVGVGAEDAVDGFDAAAVGVDVGHDDAEVVGVVADVFEEVEVGVEEVAAALVELLDVAADVTGISMVSLCAAVSGSQPSASMTAVASR